MFAVGHIMRKFLGSIVVGLCTFVYASVYWLGADNLWQVSKIVSLEQYKPWVYRQLVPILARALHSTGVPIDWALVSVATLAGIGFYLAVYDIFQHYQIKDAWAVVVCVFGLALFGYDRLPYDTMSAFLWSLGYLFIIREQDWEFMLLFPFVCLNRVETAPLLLIAYVLVGRDWMMLSGMIIWAWVWNLLHVMFADNLGTPVWISPMQNLQTLGVWGIALHVLVLLAVFRNWWRKPRMIRNMYLFLAPVFAVLYIVCGQAWEVRVFWELYVPWAILILV